MKKWVLFIVIAVFGSAAYAQDTSVKQEITNLLEKFLAGASVNDAQMHDRFWASDLIYTSSSGERYGKERIMNSIRQAPPRSDEAPKTQYTAEDITINLYGDMAVLAFKLVGTTTTAEGNSISYYLNSGTLLKRDGQWKVVNWQATKVPDTN
ncbi:MAG: nuclear transport factor 2 family protein [Balneolaceae bacterium]|nr:nuclear transport factor 2 family protein [Balneolaceae bacterium]